MSAPKPPSQGAVDDALAVLRAAGWRVREDRGFGRLLNTQPPILAMTYADPEILAMTYADPESRPYSRTVAQMSWTEVVG